MAPDIQPGTLREVMEFIEKFAREACVADSRDAREWHDDMNYIAVVAKRALETEPPTAERSDD